MSSEAWHDALFALSRSRVARELGVHVRTVQRWRQGDREPADEHKRKLVNAAFPATRRTALERVGEGGERSTVLEWVRRDRTEASLLDWLADLREHADEWVRAVPQPPTPKRAPAALLNLLPIGDHHHGMHAWARETGADDHDILRSETLLLGAVDLLLTRAPVAQMALVAVMGDFMHADTPAARTERGGHALDVDTRYSRVLRSGYELLMRTVYRALERHERVIVVIIPGNHDPVSSLVLSMLLEVAWRDCDRVRVDAEPRERKYYAHGATLLGFAHGHRRTKPTELPELMAAERTEDWGRSRQRYIYTGHVHHRRVFETRAATVESLRVLPPADAWHAAEGYGATREMLCITHHNRYGEIARQTASVLEVDDASRSDSP